MKRPIGLILSAIVLSLAALFLLLAAALTVIAGIFAGHQPSTAATSHFVIYLMLAVGVFYIALAVWAILTVIGILRLRSWARYSILIIGGGLAVFGVLTTVFSALFSHTMLPTLQAQQPTADPHLMAFVLLFVSAIYLLIAAVGIWWLVYFNLRSIREIFRPSAFTAVYPYGQPNISTLPAKPYTGFFSSPEHAPTAIKILGWLFLIFSICCLPIVFLPIPAFILGFIIPVKASHLLYLAILVIAACIGYGLLKLKNSARLALIVFALFGILNMAVTLLPWSQNHLHQYMAQVMAQFTAMLPTIPNQANPIYTTSAAMVVFNSTVGIAVNLYVLWLAHRHRPAFTAAPPMPEAF
jgi:hypothetical protein